MTGVAAPARCRRCGCTSLLARHFRRRRCPACQQREYGWSESLGLIVWGCVGGAALIWLARGNPFLGLILFYGLAFLLCVLHEATHALAAVLVGWPVHIVGIGSGGTWRLIPLGRVAVLLHRRPWSGAGFCGTGPPDDGYSRGAIAFILAAPLAMHLAAAAVAWRWAGPGTVARFFVGFNLLEFAWNAWPLWRRATDGRLLLEVLRDPERARRRWRRARWTNPVGVRILKGEYEDAFAHAEKAAAADPADPEILAAFAAAAVLTGRYGSALPHAAALAALEENSRPRRVKALPDDALAARGLFRGAELEHYVRGGMLVGADRLDEVVALSERRLDAATSEEARVLWQACVALALLLSQRDLDRADEAARHAYERLPWVPFVETAWGMARIERGDSAQGLAAFARTKKVDREGRMAGLQAAWTAVAHAAAGRREIAQDLVDTLRAPGAWPACRRRAERALSGAR